ncbi:biopolymer transport protein ExbB [Pseudorhizobium tarimense]|uniref:Biopolymer transport protein ExbB n=1 Tax=Pseudorhizobium tarimense TaxID=1079109 RepID=A0ABV2H266_9HYPH|nr:tonB-system energizer ExbB [Pseudorhizobium tarimense]MCJ8517752.1 tonB-system energizer ExbB [Pseudorhizobium tarimense]
MPFAANIRSSRNRTILRSAAIAISLLTATSLAAQEPVPAQQEAPTAETAAPGTPVAPAPEATPPQAAAPAPAGVPSAAAPSVNSSAPDPVLPAESATEPSPSVAPNTMDQPAADETNSEVPTMLQDLLPAGERSDIPHDLSPWGMFMAADWVVKGVMIGLAFASLVTWTVWLAKTLELAGARARAGRTLKIIRNSATLADAVGAAGQRGGPAAVMLRSAAEEVRLSEAALDHAENAGVKERVSSSLSRIESAAGRRMSRGTGVLATIGSTAPFVGLFGTVWGIMNAFIGISESQTTNLAVVAPGIAEALLATAIGLVAAIPAVVIYNVFARSITGYRQLLADAAAGVERLVSRDLDFRKVPPGSRKAPVSLVAGE